MTAITAAAQALAGLLRAAEEGDVPMPYNAAVSRHAPTHHPASDDDGGIDLLVDTLADLTAWATWLDEPIDDTAAPYKGNVHCHAFGMAGPVPVRVTALVPVAERVSA